MSIQNSRENLTCEIAHVASRTSYAGMMMLATQEAERLAFEYSECGMTKQDIFDAIVGAAMSRMDDAA